MKRSRFLAILLLLSAQSAPLLGAGVCVYYSIFAPSGCEMPMTGEAGSEPRGHSERPAHCADLAICAPGTAVVPALIVATPVALLFDSTTFSAPLRLLPTDPDTPPQPPPIS